MRMLRELVLISGVAIATAAFPAVAQQGQQPAPTEDHGAHHGGTDQQSGQQVPGGGMIGGMMGQGGMMGSGQQGMMGQGMMGPGMMQGGMPGMGGLFGSRVTLIMNLSVEDVRGYLAVQLDRLNNKRLKIGDIKSDDGTVTAEIVTIDNSLVQRLRIDRHTGAIEYQN